MVSPSGPWIFYNSIDIEGPCSGQGDFFLLKTLIAFNSGILKMKHIV